MTAQTKKRTFGRFVAALALATLAACGNSNNNNGSPDMAMAGGDGGAGDMSQPACVMNPMTNTELLNACTTAQTGDPAKDAPYFPTLAPNGNLPPLP